MRQSDLFAICSNDTRCRRGRAKPQLVSSLEAFGTLQAYVRLGWLLETIYVRVVWLHMIRRQHVF